MKSTVRAGGLLQLTAFEHLQALDEKLKPLRGGQSHQVNSVKRSHAHDRCEIEAISGWII